MASPDPRPVTDLLRAWGRGDEAARDDLVSLVYDDLRRRAAAYLRRERPGQTLEPTALVHEAYLKLVDQTHVQWQNRAQFFGLAAQIMRHILVDRGRARRAGKRGGGAVQVTFAEEAIAPSPGVDVTLLDAALDALTRRDPRQGRIVELRYFGGLSIDETAEVLGLSPATVKREWTMARAWLHREIAP
jgi:RNA polymerase sigma factor (TIGR02999 family)